VAEQTVAGHIAAMGLRSELQARPDDEPLEPVIRAVAVDVVQQILLVGRDRNCRRSGCRNSKQQDRYERKQCELGFQLSPSFNVWDPQSRAIVEHRRQEKTFLTKDLPAPYLMPKNAPPDLATARGDHRSPGKPSRRRRPQPSGASPARRRATPRAHRATRRSARPLPPGRSAPGCSSRRSRP